MDFPAMLSASYAYGGPYKLLMLNLRGGQVNGAILAVACYGWILSRLSSDGLPVLPSNQAIVALGAYLSAYLLALMPATWWYFDRAWFEWINVVGDALGVVGSIAVAVLTRGSTSCSGVFEDGEEAAFGSSDYSQACKLQKVVFATGICNSLMFFITCVLFLALRFKMLTRHPGKTVKESDTIVDAESGREIHDAELQREKL